MKGEEQPTPRRSVGPGQPRELGFEVLETQIEPQRGSVLLEEGAGLPQVVCRLGLQDDQGFLLSNTQLRATKKSPVKPISANSVETSAKAYWPSISRFSTDSEGCSGLT